MQYAIASILDEFNIPYKSNAQSFILDCPVCGRKDKLYINKQKGFFICWVCADNFKGSRPERVLTELTGCSTDSIKNALYGTHALMRNATDSLKLTFNDDTDANNTDEQLVPFALPDCIIDIADPLAQPGAEYLLHRGIPLAIAQEYQIKYWPQWRRVIFPVMYEGVCYGYQARMIDPAKEGDLKILSSKNIPRKSMVMFADRLKGASHAIITEGPIDAIKCSLLKGNVATMGKCITATQIEFIKKHGIKRIYFGLDRDAWPLIPQLARVCNIDAYLLKTPPGRQDLGDSTPIEILEQFNKAELITGNSLLLTFNDEIVKDK